MAQEFIHDEIESIWSEGQETETLALKDQNLSQNMSIASFGNVSVRSLDNQHRRVRRGIFNQTRPIYRTKMTARDLSIIWSSDPRYWKWTHIKEKSGELVEVAELLNVCWLQVDGKYEANKLSVGMKYDVLFVVMLKDNLWMNGPVHLKLTLPDGTKQESHENLMEKPKNRWIGLKVGEFKAPKMAGDIKLSLNGNDGLNWKTGLVVIGAVFVLKF